MIKMEHTYVYGFESAIRGMRNPKNSWRLSDSEFWHDPTCGSGSDCGKCDEQFNGCECQRIGENDLKLMKALAKAGNDHGKFLRMVNVTVDLTAPLYWWKEFDTYKVGTVANSCSTMHKIHAKEFTMDDFSHEHLQMTDDGWVTDNNGFKWCDPMTTFETLMNTLNACRDMYLKTKNKVWWWQMIQLLPSSYNQKRTVQLNYQVLKSMYFARRHHKLDEWHTLCDWMLELPYFKEVCVNEAD